MSKVWIWNHYASDMYKNKGGRHYWFAQELIKKGYEVSIFCSNVFHNSDEIIDLDNQKQKIEYVDGIRFVFVETNTVTGNNLSRVRSMYTFYKRVKSIAENRIKSGDKPDIIIGSSVHPLTMLAGVNIGRKFNIPVISEIRDLWPEAIFQFGFLKKNSLLGNMLERGEYYIYSKSDALIFTKPGDSDYIREQGWDTTSGGKIDMLKVFYINNGVDLSSFDENVKKYHFEDEDLQNNKFKVIYTGALRPVNNIDAILEAAKYLEDNNIQFLIYGSGNLEGRLKKRIVDENITNVKLKGHVEKKYIPYILSNSDLNLLHYSQNQYNWQRGNSSNKLFEYLSSGKPVLSTVKMGYSIIDKYNCGIELQDPSARELSSAILKIKNFPEEKYNKLANNARKASFHYDFRNLTTKLEEVITFVESR